MSRRPLRAAALGAALLLGGCVYPPPGGEAAASLTGEAGWVFPAVPGADFPEGQPAQLRFHADGRHSGGGLCNRLLGRYERTGSALAIEIVATTKMACPPPRMAHERHLVGFLEDVARYSITPTGALELVAEGDRRAAGHAVSDGEAE